MRFDTLSDTAIGDSDTDELHHHKKQLYGMSTNGNMMYEAKCGVVKEINRKAVNLPCCPVCNAALVESGRECKWANNTNQS